MHMNIYELIRELSGPRPLCRVVDIVSKSGVEALWPFRSKTGQPSRPQGREGVCNRSTSTILYAGVHLDA